MKDLEIFVIMCKFDDGWFPYDKYGYPGLALNEEAALEMYSDALTIFKKKEIKIYRCIATHPKRLKVEKSLELKG